MSRTETVELTVLCLLRKDDRYLLQDRIKKDWRGYTLPGGHVEPGESIVDAVVREMQEETGLTVSNPRLCGVKQFPIEGGRYLVFLFLADQFSGELISSEEGQMHWVQKDRLSEVNLVDDFHELLEVMLDEKLSEFQYVVDGDEWNAVLR
ncbi:MAG: 8-oxo-dGTP diphosphatase [Lachnospiraceae bacterium]|nr:8-oxo-dGTP diphosphatase [Lachnospiraceae bacterium]